MHISVQVIDDCRYVAAVFSGIKLCSKDDLPEKVAKFHSRLPPEYRKIDQRHFSCGNIGENIPLVQHQLAAVKHIRLTFFHCITDLQKHFQQSLLADHSLQIIPQRNPARNRIPQIPFLIDLRIQQRKNMRNLIVAQHSHANRVKLLGLLQLIDKKRTGFLVLIRKIPFHDSFSPVLQFYLKMSSWINVHFPPCSTAAVP